MGLLQRRPQFQISQAQQFYTLDVNKKYLVVGLGNYGEDYGLTRHNVGFLCIDNFSQTNEFPNWSPKKDLKSVITTMTINSNQVILMKPTKFMNNSGESVRLVMDYYKIPINNVLVIHDDIDIDLGTIKIKLGGSSAGHNGIKSVIESIGDNFLRARVGIGPKHPANIDSTDYVLADFSKTELNNLPSLYREVTSIISEFINNIELKNDTRSYL